MSRVSLFKLRTQGLCDAIGIVIQHINPSINQSLVHKCIIFHLSCSSSYLFFFCASDARKEKREKVLSAKRFRFGSGGEDADEITEAEVGIW